MPQWPYVLPPQLVNYVDRRVLNQITSDTDDDVNTVVEFANTGGATYLMVLEQLKSAATEIDGAVTEAGKYDVADLVWLADPPAAVAAGEMPKPDHGALLRKLNAGLWVRGMQDRRVRPDPEAGQTRRLGDWAAEFLEKVRMGQGLVPAKGALGLLPADLVAAREAAVGRIAGNVVAGQPGKTTTIVGTTACPFPARMFGNTPCPDDHDRLSDGYRDGGLAGP